MHPWFMINFYLFRFSCFILFSFFIFFIFSTKWKTSFLKKILSIIARYNYKTYLRSYKTFNPYYFYFQHLVSKTLLACVGIVSYKRFMVLMKKSWSRFSELCHNHIYFLAIIKFSNRSIQYLFSVEKRTCMDSRKLRTKKSFNRLVMQN